MLLSSLLAVTTVQGAPDRIGDLGLLDGSGEFHQFSRYRHKDALVLMSYAANCSTMDSLVADFRDVQSQWEGQNVIFLLIDSIDIGRAEVAMTDAELPILVDSGQVVSETLDITSAGEVLVLDPERLPILYRGPVRQQLDSRRQGAVAGTVENTPVMDTTSTCAADYSTRDLYASSIPDYATEVAPIIAENCATCHREGGICHQQPFDASRLVSGDSRSLDH